MNTRNVGFFLILLMCAAVTATVFFQWLSARELAREEFIKDAKSATRTEAVVIERAFRSIYENLRTLSSLPGVRALDRHGKNLSPEARVTIQHVYNNLASSVSVSEVYFTPIDFNHKKFDPVTGKDEEPILMFDELIINAGLNMSYAERFSAPEQVKSTESVGPAEIESFEYVQLEDHAAWLKANHARIGAGGQLEIPFIAGPEVLTCDNTHYISTHNDADRSGIIFSVPFYDVDGDIRGMVSAIILTKAIKALIHKGHYALVNVGNSYMATSENSEIPLSALGHARAAKPDPDLIYSEAITFGVKDWRHQWHVWAGVPNSEFFNSKNKVLADRTRNTILIVIAILALAALVALSLTDRLIRQSRTLASGARAAQEEAQLHNERLLMLNEDVTRLNGELSSKITELRRAQDEIISKGKMAQLGHLVAMVAHEIRNPLGGIRTATFLMRRKLHTTNGSQETILDRIDSGIARCDDIITQLLDFSRSGKPVVEHILLDEWLEKILAEEAANMPANVTIACNLGLGAESVEMDPHRLRRAIINLVSNGYEAMMDANQVMSKCTGGVPRITLTTRETERGVEIDVADNGPGITPDVLAQIREPLYTTKSFGTGLGIPAVEKIAELHNGGLDVKTEIGVGTVFTFWLPIMQPREEDRAAA